VKRERKHEIVKEVREALLSALTVVVVYFKGTSVAEMQEIRAELRKEGADIRVVKNTLLVKAVEDTEYALLDQLTGGQIAVIWSETDPGYPAKVAAKFAKDLEHFEIRGGVLSGKLLNVAGVDQLATLPSRDEMRARFLALLNASASQFLRLLTAAPRDFLGVLKAREEQLNEAA